MRAEISKKDLKKNKLIKMDASWAEQMKAYL